LVRTEAGYRAIAAGRAAQVVSLLLLYLSCAGLAFGSVGYVTGQQRLGEQTEQLEAYREVAESSRQARDVAEARLRQMISDLERMGGQQRDTIDVLGELRLTLGRELEMAQEELAALHRERDEARELAAREREAARRLAAAVQDGTREDASAADASQASRERDADEALVGQLASLEAKLAATTSERDELRRTERGLRWRVGMLETRLAEMRESVNVEAGRMREWVARQVSALEGVLATSGVDVDRLLRRVGRLSSGQGGPLEPVPPPRGVRGAAAAGAVAFQPALSREFSRLSAVHAVLQAMPLVPPMRTYRQTSEFGVRRDPITGRRALHTGLDFGGPYGARVLATAPGRVVSAGRAGAYGIMVEVDHGMGIHTRFGHLKEALVKPGDRVALHDPVGVMGSTGRSTGEHLHYEVRVDGVAYDPADFLEAGRHLGHVLKG
jgi:murein DD-endopeptidase MepM/ murein hydrolase activator NlpD